MERVSDDELLSGKLLSDEKLYELAASGDWMKGEDPRIYVALKELQARREAEKSNGEKPLAARPISGKETDQLMESSENALMALRGWSERMKRDNKADEMRKMLDSAIAIFSRLRNEWALAIGHPQEISGETLVKILEAAIHQTRDILKEQIERGEH